MKAFTDIEQSKKLAEILPVESADAFYDMAEPEKRQVPIIGNPDDYYDMEDWTISCWSLAALLEVLPNEISTGENFANKYQIDIRKYDGGDGTTWYQIAYGNDRGSSGEWHDMINTGEKENIIDCCYQMIVRLKEKDLLK